MKWLRAHKHKRQLERAEARSNPVLGLKLWMKRGAIGLGAVILALVLVLGQQTRADIQRDNDRVANDARQEVERVDRSVEACHNYNQDQTDDRNTAIQGLRQFAIVFLDVTPAEADTELHSARGQEFVEYINDKNTYRQCSRHCVVLQTKQDAEHCAPAKNENGDAP